MLTVWQGNQCSVAEVTCGLTAELDLTAVSGQIVRHLLHFSRGSRGSLAVPTAAAPGAFQLLVNNLG
jgi:hypothetical protein